MPDGWSAQVLLISGLTPVVSYAATLCKAARAARRHGTLVVVDVNARRHLWMGRDPRAITMVLREADVVRCSAEDRAVLGLDAEAIQARLRPKSIFVASSGGGDAWAVGPFGKVVSAPRKSLALRASGAGDAFTAAICAELSRAGHAGESHGGLWETALERGQAAMQALGPMR
jgi:sugar/nucleoside kinase (ribokinase family)